MPEPGWLALQAVLSLLSFRRFAQSLATLDQIEAPVRPSGTTAGFRLAAISDWGCAVNLRAADITGLGVQAGDYDRIRSGNYARRGQEPDPSTEFNAAVAHYRERFNGFVDRTAGSVTDMTRQFAAWLRKRPEGQDGDSDTDD